MAVERFLNTLLGINSINCNTGKIIKQIDTAELGENDPRELERRLLLDSYKTFGCENGEPTFRYSLVDGVKEGFLVNPVVVDARTEITTQLLSDQGYTITTQNDDGEEVEETYIQKDFEKKFFSENTNKAFCRAFLDNAYRDPISGEIGKQLSFVFRKIMQQNYPDSQ